MNDKALASEEQVEEVRQRVWDALSEALGDAMDCTRVWSAWSYGIMSQHDFHTVANDDSRMAGLVDAVIQAALGSSGWRPITEAPAETPVWVFDPTQDPQQFVATLTEGYEGPFWKPAEELVADVLTEYLSPTGWRTLPPPPSSEEG